MELYLLELELYLSELLGMKVKLPRDLGDEYYYEMYIYSAYVYHIGFRY